jgi:hypothetical protein
MREAMFGYIASVRRVNGQSMTMLMDEATDLVAEIGGVANARMVIADIAETAPLIEVARG